MIDELAPRSLVFVTGKGGTGKTTLTAALGLALSQRGRRVLLAEVDNARPALESLFGRGASFQPQSVAPRLHIANIDFLNALRAYLVDVVRLDRVVSLILKNRVVQYFLQATPGARELVILSRILSLTQSKDFDTVIVDLPASGHARSLFQTLHTISRLFSVGPLRQRGDEIQSLVADPDHSALILLAIPEEMSVNEAIETARDLRRLGMPPLSLVVLNQDPGPGLPADERRSLGRLKESLASSDQGSARLRAAVRALDHQQDHSARAAQARASLQEALGMAPRSLPSLGGRDGAEAARALAAWLSSPGGSA